MQCAKRNAKERCDVRHEGVSLDENRRCICVCCARMDRRRNRRWVWQFPLSKPKKNKDASGVKEKKTRCAVSVVE
jgi:hypothetical protein